MICLTKLLYWEAAEYAGYKKTVLRCDECPFKENCNDGAKEETKDEQKSKRRRKHNV